MKVTLLGILIIIHLGCKGQNKEQVLHKETHKTTKVSHQLKTQYIQTLKELKSVSDSSKSYESIKNSIKAKKLDYQGSPTDSISNLFTISLVNRIIPFWEGTPWSFEGHTSVPRKGKIACGYFVSTTLKHIGVNINRYKLAQQSPINEAQSLGLESKVFKVSENSIDKNISKIYSTLTEGIHFIGFDTSHVGYILKTKDQLYLIHSNYIDSKGVEIEKIEDSDVFASYAVYYISELSTNKHLLKNWIHGTEIKVISSN